MDGAVGIDPVEESCPRSIGDGVAWMSLPSILTVKTAIREGRRVAVGEAGGVGHGSRISCDCGEGGC